MRFLRYLSWVFLASNKILVTFAIFAIFADISGPFSASLLSKSGMLLHLLFLRFLRYLSWVFLASKKNPCYFYHFCDICGHFGGSSWFLLFLSLEFCYICYFCDFCDTFYGCFKPARKILVTFAIFADLSGPFLASSFSKSRILLHLLFLRFLGYLSWVFLASKKNPCHFCDFAIFADISGTLLGFLSS